MARDAAALKLLAASLSLSEAEAFVRRSMACLAEELSGGGGPLGATSRIASVIKGTETASERLQMAGEGAESLEPQVRKAIFSYLFLCLIALPRPSLAFLIEWATPFSVGLIAWEQVLADRGEAGWGCLVAKAIMTGDVDTGNIYL